MMPYPVIQARAAAMVMALAVSCVVTMAQDKKDQPQNPSPDPTVKLNVFVLNEQNRTVTDVRQDEFHVYEDGAEQRISLFMKEAVPLSYGLVVDNSGSLRTQFGQVTAAAKTVINQTRPEDEAFIIRFVTAEEIDVLQDFTSNTEAMLETINGMETENGATALVDAIYLAAQHLSEHAAAEGSQPRRHALIVITDGQDLNSYYNPSALVKLLHESDVQIFVIGLVQELEKEPGMNFKKYSRKHATDLLDYLAQETGGRTFYPQSAAQVTQAAGELMHDLWTQYIIGYSPTKKPKEKEYRKLKVTLARPKESAARTVITRRGYAIPGKPKQQKS